jgi:hypothetical protein
MIKKLTIAYGILCILLVFTACGKVSGQPDGTAVSTDGKMTPSTGIITAGLGPEASTNPSTGESGKPQATGTAESMTAAPGETAGTSAPVKTPDKTQSVSTPTNTPADRPPATNKPVDSTPQITGTPTLPPATSKPPAQSPEPSNQLTSSPQNTTPPPAQTDPPKPKSGFEKPYDLTVITDYAKSYGESIGMIWGESLAKDNCSWEAPIYTTSCHTEAEMKQAIQIRIDRVKYIQENNGYRQGQFYFKLYLEPIDNGEYLMYWLIG